MIQLFHFGEYWGLPDASPFCLKVIAYMKMAGIPFESRRGNPRKAPKGKLPLIQDGDKWIADSGLIIEYLKQNYGDKLDAHLTASQRGIALAFQRLFEEHLYWSAVKMRWLDPVNFPLTRQAFFSGLPLPLRLIAPPLVQRGMRSARWHHGIGRHSEEEEAAMAKANLQAVADFLGEKPFMFGDKACSLDAIAYGFLANLFWAPHSGEIKTFAQSLPLESYCLRMKQSFNL